MKPYQTAPFAIKRTRSAPFTPRRIPHDACHNRASSTASRTRILPRCRAKLSDGRPVSGAGPLSSSNWPINTRKQQQLQRGPCARWRPRTHVARDNYNKPQLVQYTLTRVSETHYNVSGMRACVLIARYWTEFHSIDNYMPVDRCGCQRCGPELFLCVIAWHFFLTSALGSWTPRGDHRQHHHRVVLLLMLILHGRHATEIWWMVFMCLVSFSHPQFVHAYVRECA